MAVVKAYLPFDMTDLDFSRLFTGGYDYGLLDDVYLTFDGRIYTDAYYVDWFAEGGFASSLFLGPTLTVDATDQITGGTVTGYVELVSDGVYLYQSWSLTGIAVSATAIAAASATSSTDDDYQLIIRSLAGNDRFVLSAGDDVAFAFGGDDTLLGGAGWDILLGGAGHDLIQGGSGSDGLSGDAGNDRLFGNAGDDVLAMDTGNDVINGGTGRDALLITGGRGAQINLGITSPQFTGFGRDTIRSIEDIYGGGGSDRFTGSGASNVLEGRGGNDKLMGQGGHDTLIGGAGNDVLQGGVGNDRLEGGTGADILEGGVGRDVMVAGLDASRDVFVFRSHGESRPGGMRDQIDQFDSGEDVIDLRGIDANLSLAGNQRFAFSTDGPAAHAAWVVDTGAHLILRADVNGDGNADFELLLLDTPSIEVADLLL